MNVTGKTTKGGQRDEFKTFNRREAVREEPERVWVGGTVFGKNLGGGERSFPPLTGGI